MFALSKWQRLISAFAALICISRAGFLASQSEPAGSAFIAASVFAILTLSPARRDGDALFPNPRHFFARNWRRIGAGALTIAIIATGAAIFQGQRQMAENARLAKESSQAEANRQAIEKNRLAQIEKKYAGCLKDAARIGGGYRPVLEGSCAIDRNRDIAIHADPIAETLAAMRNGPQPQ